MAAFDFSPEYKAANPRWQEELASYYANKDRLGEQTALTVAQGGPNMNLPRNKQYNVRTSNPAGPTSSGSDRRASNSLQEQQDKLRKSLGGQFGGTIDAYKKMIGWLPEDQNSLQMQVENLANSQKTSIGNALNSALEKFGGYRNEVDQNQKGTLDDLAQNTRNLFQAGNNYLGARGAGNSSATGMYSAALTQQANRQRGDILSQYDGQRNEINMKEQDTRALAQQQIDAVETWKATRVSEIVQQYQELKRQLTIAKAQADDAKKQALAKLDASLFESAINKLNSIQGLASQYKSEVNANIGSQVQQLAGMVGQVGQTARAAAGSVQDVNAIPLDGIEQGRSMQDGTIVGYYNGRKVRVDQQGNLLAYLD